LILSKIQNGLTTDNLNGTILSQPDKVRDLLDIGKFNFDTDKTNSALKEQLKTIVIGATNSGDIEKTKLFDKFYSTHYTRHWNQPNIQILFNKIKESIFYSKFIQSACNNRRTEGLFINSSLRALSKDMINIINYKNKDTVYFLPNIVDGCLSSYCKTKSSCFSLNRVDKPELESVILKNIAQQLGYDNKRDEFFEKIELCIFGLFNWSRIANDPPPVPYVNINKAKEKLNNFMKYKNGIEEFRDELSILIENIKKDNLSTNKLEILKNILVNANKVETFDTTKQKEIWNVFEEIDTNNATTAIGTIEFIDKISKLNSIESSCFELKTGVDNYKNVYSIQDNRDRENKRSTTVF
jgi:hypothetical protein